MLMMTSGVTTNKSGSDEASINWMGQRKKVIMAAIETAISIVPLKECVKIMESEVTKLIDPFVANIFFLGTFRG